MVIFTLQLFRFDNLLEIYSGDYHKRIIGFMRADQNRKLGGCDKFYFLTRLIAKINYARLISILI